MQIKKQIITRFAYAYFGVLAIGIAIIVRVLFLQFFQGEKWEKKAETLTYRDMIIEPNRGDIYSHNHKLLATSVPFFEVHMDMQASFSKEIFDKNVDSLAFKLAELFEDKTKTQYLKDLTEAYKKGSRYFLLQRKVNYAKLKQLKKLPILRRGRYRGGLIAEQENKRDKPFKSLASRTLGRLKNEGERHEDIEKKKSDAVIGLEGAYDHILKGNAGVRLVRKLSNNVWMPINDENEVEPVDGIDIITTIDIDIQDATHNALKKQLIKQKAHHGTAIVMEVATGEIRAISNLRLNSKDTTYQSYYEYYNYAVGESTEPGSTFKLASLIAALEDKKVNMTDTVHTYKGTAQFYGFPIRDSKKTGHGLINTQEAFEVSSNIGIAKIIDRSYRNKPEEFIARLYSMGLNQLLGIEIKGEAQPYIKYTNDKLWTKVSLAQMSIGYEVKLTPLQILTFYNAIANNGKMMRPMFVKAQEEQGRIRKYFEPHVLNPSICSETTIKQAQRLLEGVVLRGTAKNIKTSQYRIAGKTGTAKIFDEKKKQYISKYKASFAGYFPADKPKYSCFVMISAPETGLYYGNTVAAPVFKEISDKIYLQELEFQQSEEFWQNPETAKVPYTKNGDKKDLDFLLEKLSIASIEPNNFNSDWVITTKRDQGIEYGARTIDTKSVPIVTGMGAKDAIYILENLGLRVNIQGRGSVISQSVAPGTPLKKGETITIELI